MVIRLFISCALIVLAAGFLWFAGNVIYLGVREFFKLKKNESSSSVDKTTSSDPTSNN